MVSAVSDCQMQTPVRLREHLAGELFAGAAFLARGKSMTVTVTDSDGAHPVVAPVVLHLGQAQCLEHRRHIAAEASP